MERGKGRGGGQRQRGEGEGRGLPSGHRPKGQGQSRARLGPGWDPGWSQAEVEVEATRLGPGVTSPSSIAKAASALAPSRMSTA